MLVGIRVSFEDAGVVREGAENSWKLYEEYLQSSYGDKLILHKVALICTYRRNAENGFRAAESIYDVFHPLQRKDCGFVLFF